MDHFERFHFGRMLGNGDIEISYKFWPMATTRIEVGAYKDVKDNNRKHSSTAFRFSRNRALGCSARFESIGCRRCSHLCKQRDSQRLGALNSTKVHQNDAVTALTANFSENAVRPVPYMS